MPCQVDSLLQLTVAHLEARPAALSLALVGGVAARGHHSRQACVRASGNILGPLFNPSDTIGTSP